jgi:3-oxoacyl-[acyl-carrier protein] reductase
MEPDVEDLSRSVQGLTIVITGAASGIGRAAAHVFAREGANVIVTDINASGCASVSQAIGREGGNARAWTLDVSDPNAIIQVINDAAAHFGGIDLIVNNAGVPNGLPIEDEGYDELWSRSLPILLTAHARVIRAALPYLRKSACPRIVNIASTEALGATARNSIYAAAKAGVTGLTRALAVELGPLGITVNCICPGPINTGITQKIPDSDKQAFANRRTALRRYGNPLEVAHTILSFCLPAASYITGAVIPVDGGLMARNA